MLSRGAGSAGMLRTAESVCKRLSSTITAVDVLNIAQTGPCVALNVRKDDVDGRIVLPLVWLRDHCRSQRCYNHSTNQRRSNSINILEESRIESERSVRFDRDTQQLTIDWADGHTSTFDAHFLAHLIVRPTAIPIDQLYHLWTRATLNELPVIDNCTFDTTEFARKFVDYGFVCVDGVEKTAEATEKFCRNLAPIHDTFFGSFWVFNNKGQQQDIYHEDTAYGNEEIGPHTDGTYFPDTPGIQVFHCLRPADKGGENLLVDGFAAAERLRREDPEAWRILTTINIDHHYIEKGTNPLFSWSPSKPVIELNEDGGILQIRFNPYDRAPLRLSLTQDDALSSPHDVVAFYRAYQAFSRICHDPAMAIKIGLQPGTIIFIDNLRVMHARTAFSGFRQMCGCYLSRDNLMAKIRLHLRKETQLQV